MSIIEAAFCGLPVVSTAVGAAPEITKNIVKPGDYNSLAEKIIEVIQDPVSNYHDLSEKFSIEKCAGRFYETYLSLVQRTS
jgi:glycosyltransferase involved in cell wall biosynthesis